MLADIEFSDLFWSMLWFFFLIIWLMILLRVLEDLFRDHTLSGWSKVVWLLFLVLLPFLAVFVYLIARGEGMAKRGLEHQKHAIAQFNEYAKSVGGSSGAGSDLDQIARAKQLLDAGAIDQAEFDKLKAKVLG
ncbi:MAG: hypothetical protein QOJ69_441 [Actinomycetota bacterium]|nr:hypothetical protein [Actinomycetota bacterium]